jgi:catechol 2,3-dioxygenase-like lactoylglutathione lyase family enzyme
MLGHHAAPRARVGSIVIRCRRFDEMLAFWAQALGYVPREEPEADWVVLTDPSGRGPNVSLARVTEPLAPALDAVSPLHLDLYTTDGAAEAERLLSLGATRYPAEPPADADFEVLVDPDGYRFCVVQK